MDEFMADCAVKIWGLVGGGYWGVTQKGAFLSQGLPFCIYFLATTS